MATKPNVKSFQDVPPPNGYPQINYKKGLRPRGFPGWFIWSTVIGCTIFGFYRLGNANERRRFLKKEKREARIAIYPYLQAEGDRELHEIIVAQLKREEEIMKNVEGWKVGQSVYSKRWSNPAQTW